MADQAPHDDALPNDSQGQDFAHRLLRPVQGKQWFAVHCKPRSEKIVAQHCETWGILHYLPLRRQVHRYPRKVAVFHVPLFPGYLFCAIGPAERLSLLRTNRVVSFLTVPDEQAFLEELRQVFLATHVTDQIKQTEFDPTGRLVVVLTGPLAGLRGRVVDKRGKTGLRLNLGMLSQAALVQIDLAKVQIEYLDEP